MKKKLLLGLTALLLLTITLSFTLSSEVYICDSTGAKKYHYSSTCRGLNACKHQIVKITKGQAESRGRTLCGWED